MTTQFKKGLILASVCVLIWSITFINTRALLHDFSALEIQVLRFALAFGILLFIPTPSQKIPKRDEAFFALLGLTGVAIYQLLENCAIHYTNASNVSILVSLCPIVTALLMWIFKRGNRPNLIFGAGFLVAITGVTCVSLNGIKEFHFRPLGDGIALMAMLSWGFYSMLLSTAFKRGYNQITVVRHMFFWTIIITSPLIILGTTAFGKTLLSGSLAINLNLAQNLDRFTNLLNLVNLGFLGILASAACFVWWNKACNNIGIVRCSLGLYLLPPLTVIFAYFLLDEQITVVSAVGTILTLLGVIISNHAIKQT